MRKLLYLISFIFVGLRCAANPIDVSTAHQIAMQFMNTLNSQRAVARTHETSLPQLDLVYTQKGVYGNVLYVFNQTQEQGFVIISADDSFLPVLGYSDNGFFDVNNTPDGLKDLLDGYEKQLSYAIKNNIRNSHISLKMNDIEPLIQTQWGQREPYNNLCPIDPETGEHAITGCGATAIAQLLYYHRFPQKGKNSISYEWNGRTFSADFSEVSFEWDKMKLTYDEDTHDNDNAVATLLYYCALAMKSEFTAYDTNSWFDTDFLSTYFGYKRDIKMLWKKDSNADDFEDIIYQDLLKGLPVFCWAEALGKDWSHLFLIDGCNSNGYFHMNFGWNGNEDGYYVLSPIDVGWMNMDEFHCILYNIQPDIPGKWFLQTDDNRYYEMSTIGGIEPDPDNETDLMLVDISGNILAKGIAEVSFIQTDGSIPTYFIKGDVNGDGVVDTIDVEEVVQYIMNKPSDCFNIDAADVNDDGFLNVADIVGIINTIIKQQ